MALSLCKNQGLMFIKTQTLPHNSNHIFNTKDKLGFQPLRSYTRLHKFGDDRRRRKLIVHSVEPGASPSGPPANIIWVVATGLALAIPFVTHKWGPLIKGKLASVLQSAEDVAEAVESVAERVEKVAEDVEENIPEGGKLREAVDFIEKIAEEAAKDAGAIDDFIDKVQEEEEKAQSSAESLKDESKKPLEDTKEEKPSDGKLT